MTAPETADRESSWHASTREYVQLIELVRELMIVYEGLHGGPPPLVWLLKEIGFAA